MNLTYAKDTDVSVEKSRAEIETVLSKYGADRFAYMTSDCEAVVGFSLNGKFIKFTLPLPSKADPAFTVQTYYRAGVKREGGVNTPERARALWEQACRSKWRSLNLAIKAKLEAVEAGITTFEKEFLAHIVMPGGGTVGDRIIPQLDEMAQSGKLPKLLLLE